EDFDLRLERGEALNIFRQIDGVEISLLCGGRSCPRSDARCSLAADAIDRGDADGVERESRKIRERDGALIAREFESGPSAAGDELAGSVGDEESFRSQRVGVA